MLSSLRSALGSLDRVRDWVTLNGFVNADPGEHGRHARTAIGVAALPLNLPVIMSAEVIVTP